MRAIDGGVVAENGTANKEHVEAHAPIGSAKGGKHATGRLTGERTTRKAAQGKGGEAIWESEAVDALPAWGPGVSCDGWRAIAPCTTALHMTDCAHLLIRQGDVANHEGLVDANQDTSIRAGVAPDVKHASGLFRCQGASASVRAAGAGTLGAEKSPTVALAPTGCTISDNSLNHKIAPTGRQA